MLEDEARKKWCPFVRMNTSHDDDTGTDAVESNRSEMPKFYDNSHACIASDCACWAWDNEHKDGCTAAGFPANGHCGLMK